MTDIQEQLDNELDARYEAQETLQAMIDARVEDLMKDDDEVEELIAENADVIWSIIKKGGDVQVNLMESLKHWAECVVEGEL